MKDNLDSFIKEGLEKASGNMTFSESLKLKIKAETIDKEMTFADKVRLFLNRDLELPLVPLFAAVAIAAVLLIVPVKSLKTLPEYGKIITPSEYKTISLGTSSIIIDNNHDKYKNGDDPYENY